jgi:hypothetical protein
MSKYTVEIECEEGYEKYVVVKWQEPTAGFKVGQDVYRDNSFANCVAMAEEYQYNDQCNEWALYNNQESEFDYV